MAVIIVFVAIGREEHNSGSTIAGVLETAAPFLIALAIAPILSELLDGLSDSIWGREIVLGGLAIFVPGVRLTMWVSAIIIVMAGGLAMWSLRAGSGAFLAEAESEPSA